MMPQYGMLLTYLSNEKSRINYMCVRRTCTNLLSILSDRFFLNSSYEDLVSVCLQLQLQIACYFLPVDTIELEWSGEVLA